MTHSGSWSPYIGGDAIILAVVLFVITGIAVYLGMRLSKPIAVKRSGKARGILIVLALVVSILAFGAASTIYVLALVQQAAKQGVQLTAPANPITPFTAVLVALGFFGIVFLTQRSGPWIAAGSAIVGVIAAPWIFEFPFDLIVMWHTYPPSPAILYTLLYFLPLLVIALVSFALLTLSPLVVISRSTLFLLAAMFLTFAVWALFGFAYPSATLPIVFNVIGKALAFATAVSLFLPEGKLASIGSLIRGAMETQWQAPSSSGMA